MQVNMVDWLKLMVGSKRSEEVIDPSLEPKPSRTALKRALLTALRCVDPDSQKRLTMSEVVRMLESEDYPLSREVCLQLLEPTLHNVIDYVHFNNMTFTRRIAETITNHILCIFRVEDVREIKAEPRKQSLQGARSLRYINYKSRLEIRLKS